MKINRIIKILIISNVVWISGSGLLAPIFAIFITQQIVGGNVEIAGFAAAIYSIGFCLARLPSAKWVDKKMDETKRLHLYILSGVLVALCYFFYALIYFPWQLYLLQFLIGIAMAFNASPFVSFFTRFIDKGEESFEWGINAVALTGGQAVTAAVGGVLASRFGFDIMFIAAGLFIFLSSLMLIVLYKNLK
jgi:MFS family permease